MDMLSCLNCSFVSCVCVCGFVCFFDFVSSKCESLGHDPDENGVTSKWNK